MKSMLKFFVLLILVCSMPFTIAGTKSRSYGPKYEIVFSAPKNMKWSVKSNIVRKKAAIKLYVSGKKTKSQRILVFFRGKQASLAKMMAGAIKGQKRKRCTIKTNKTLSRSDNSLSFKLSSLKCKKNADLVEIYKLFKMPDGTYYILYLAKPNTISSKTINAMEKVIKNAEIKPIKS